VPDPDVRRSAERFVSRSAGRESRYSFSYGEHYDAANTHFGVLLAHNDETLEPGAGYDNHPHRHLEILTWVLAGTLTHRDSTGEHRAVPAGWVQVVSTGTGIRHSETNEHDEPVRYLQMWVAPATRGDGPAYDAHPLPSAGAAPLTPPGQPAAGFSVVRPDRLGITVPAAAYRHLVRFTEAGEDRVRGEPGSLVGIWVMHSALGG